MPTQVLIPRFYRRADLTVNVRMRIASIALFFSVHGSISKLAHKYSVSRQFIYDLRKDFAEYGKDRFGDEGGQCGAEEERPVVEWILSLRLEGKSTIEGISSVLKRFGLPHSSVGHISQELKRIGDKQGNLLALAGSDLRVVFCCDEIFSKGQAILMTVDPISLAILHIELSGNRKGETWASHWGRLLSEGYAPIFLCNDEGLGMSSAQVAALPGTGRQSDTYHAVAHRLGAWAGRLEKAALKHIGEEYECKRLLENAKTGAARLKRHENHQKAVQKAQTSIALSDTFVFLYHCLLEAFHIFDAKGNLRDSDKALADFDTALVLIKSLGHQDIGKEIKSIESSKADLFHFMSVAQESVKQLTGQVPPDVLKTLCQAWQTHKNAIKAKQTGRKNALKRKEGHLLQQLGLGSQNNALDTPNEMDTWKKLVYGELDKIIQSSAAVECINSILRPYLNASKNQVTQSALNLFMAYHNHRRFKAGERKDKTPYEILTGETQNKDWLALMLEKAA